MKNKKFRYLFIDTLYVIMVGFFNFVYTVNGELIHLIGIMSFAIFIVLMTIQHNLRR